MKTKILLALAIILAFAGVVYTQTNFTEVDHILFRPDNPQIRFAGTLKYAKTDGTQLAMLSQTGAWVTAASTGVISASSGTTALTAAQSGSIAVNTGTSSTTTFTLPAAAAGLNYCFVEDGNAAGELLVGVTGKNTVVGKTHGAEDGSGIATGASTGIKNTAATNVKGDFACLVALDTSTWLMYSVAGVWASR
jgi:hypothetical protein